MTISLGNALKSVKADEHFIKKILIGGLIYLVSIIGDVMIEMKDASVGVITAGIVLYLLFYAILLGFMVSTTNKKLNADFSGWTEWSESNILLKGLKCMLCYFIYTLIIGLIFFIAAFAVTLFLALAVGLIGYLINLVLHLNPQIAANLFVIMFATVAIVAILYLVQFLNVAYLFYCKDFKIRDLMAFKKHFRAIAEDQHAAWTLVGKIILYVLLLMLVIIVACITLIGVFALPFICFASFMALVDLFVQYGKKIDIVKYIAE